MTVERIKELLVSADPDCQRYDHDRAGEDNYTTWQEVGRLNVFGNGAEEGTIHFQVDRFTRDEGDSVAALILTTLEGQEDIAVEYLVDYEKDTGYIHHIYDCEGV